MSDQPVAKATTYTARTKHNRIIGGKFFVRAFFSFLRSVLFIHCVPLYPLSSYHIFRYNTENQHPCLRRDSNPRSQQPSDRPMPYTARTPAPAKNIGYMRNTNMTV